MVQVGYETFEVQVAVMIVKTWRVTMNVRKSLLNEIYTAQEFKVVTVLNDCTYSTAQSQINKPSRETHE